MTESRNKIYAKNNNHKKAQSPMMIGLFFIFSEYAISVALIFYQIS